MKVGILIDRLTVGGVEKIAIEQVKAMQNLDIDVSLLLLSRTGLPPSAFKKQLNNIKIIYLEDRFPKLLRLNFKIPLFSFFSFFHLSYPIVLPFFVKRKEFDFILSHNSYTTFSAISLKWTRSIHYGIYVHDLVGYILKNAYKGMAGKMFKLIVPIANFADKVLCKNADIIFVQNEETREAVKEIIGNDQKIQMMTPAHNIVSSANSDRQDYFILASAWKEGKNLEALFELDKKLKSINFVIAGKWIHERYKLKIESLINGTHNNSYQILGEVSENKLDSLYRNARAAILLSAEKGFGLVSVEAASNGTTFIIPEVAGSARIFKDKKECFKYRLNSLKDLEKYITLLNDDKKLADTMGTNALLLMKNKFSWQTHAEQLYTSILSVDGAA